MWFGEKRKKDNTIIIIKREFNGSFIEWFTTKRCACVELKRLFSFSKPFVYIDGDSYSGFFSSDFLGQMFITREQGISLTL